jgi:hypothetical protein
MAYAASFRAAGMRRKGSKLSANRPRSRAVEPYVYIAIGAVSLSMNVGFDLVLVFSMVLYALAFAALPADRATAPVVCTAR